MDDDQFVDIDLIVDVMDPPRSVVELLRQRGIDIDIRGALKRIKEEQSAIILP